MVAFGRFLRRYKFVKWKKIYSVSEAICFRYGSSTSFYRTNFNTSCTSCLCLARPLSNVWHRRCGSATTFHHVTDDTEELSNKHIKEHRITQANVPAVTAVNEYSLRSHTCGELHSGHCDQNVSLYGWLQYIRLDKFAVLRDGYGSIQLIVAEDRPDIAMELKDLSLESVIAVKGKVQARPLDQVNKRMPTGEVEVVLDHIAVLNPANKSLPFQVTEYNKANEHLRMQYRYLDLRFHQMQRNLRFRSKFMMRMREFLINQREFVEVETPTLFRRTPGGAQEFLVPTRYPGEFYALVQSPQQLKQLLMVGAMDRYFQIARCYRDEGTKPDRQPEFTQLDLELSFTNRESIMALTEDVLAASWPTDKPPLQLPFPRLTHKQASQLYGTDKPDTTYDNKIEDISHLVTSVDANYITARALVFKHAASHMTNALQRKYKKVAQDTGNVRLSVLKFGTSDDEWVQTVSKTKLSCDPSSLKGALRLQSGDVLLLAVGPEHKVLPVLGDLRKKFVAELRNSLVGEELSEQFNFLWVVDFPLFEAGPEPGSLESAHHPFTRPHPDDLPALDSEPLTVRGLHYDLVLNGVEVGGGSMRVHEPALQRRILSKLRIPADQLDYLLTALGAGCPPHGGIALGLDRLVSLIVGAQSIREVIAFPKGADGRDFLSGAPSHILDQEKHLYHLVR